MIKRMTGKNVLQAAQERIARLFAEFEYVYVSFSGGKDSSVILHLALDHVRQHCPGRRLGVFHIDYEAQYQATTDHVRETFDALPEWCDKYWCAMPLSVPCCTSMSQSTWIPWHESERDIWVRDLPEGSINLSNHAFDFYRYGMEDYDFQKQFGDWVARTTGKKTACLIGVRADESYDRRIMLANTVNARKYPGILWSTGGIDDSGRQFNFYPIHDWSTDDVWIYHGRFNKPYNRLYDLFHQAGLTLPQMRVASPFISQGIESLKLYRAVEPHTWGKLVSRVNGVNFSGIYGGTTAMGWKSITKPKHHTWKSYLEFLLATLPAETRQRYEEKFRVSKEFWTTRGGVLEDDVVADIRRTGEKVEIKKESAYKTVKQTVVFQDYPDELDITEFKAVPSHKRMVVCILKNDHLCKYMGFTLTKEEQQRRAAVLAKYKDL